ncbi:tRNA (mnm(5)s(2)U34)-methyltransferase [Lactococcus fujiensis]|uniref:SAM-dependent methyltransferase n=1 Tax=Lactococcus fujiensis JCM 16395 TaxID=1291764 RepID=A0A2A5RI54_9LACT|nr:class I SAM-dependent methyltransferase [Lactococcus fujiensis]PCR98802.1 SAM-dependent methyltransferase [Lactococcus fujiensis JCM 16395]
MIKPQEVAHELLSEVIEVDDVVVDATMGNGHDTLFLAKLSNHVYAFDVQEQAIESTRKRLSQAGKRAHLILDGHENVANYVKGNIKAAVFNLGYLPQADKSIITLPDTTLRALSALTDKLIKGGRIAIMLYYGHPGGREEKDRITKWVTALPQQDWHVYAYGALNQVHTPPQLIIIEKR